MTRGTGIMLAVSIGVLAWLVMDQQRQIDRLDGQLTGLADSTIKLLDLDIQLKRQRLGLEVTTGDD